MSTFLKIDPQIEEFTTSFYQILFDKYPQMQLLFSATDVRQQRIKLSQSLQLVISNVNNAEALKDILKALGARHVEYGTVLSDYPLIGDSLLQALEKHLDRDWNEEVKQTWADAYQMIAQTMMQGAQEATSQQVAAGQAVFKKNAAVDHSNTSNPNSIFIKLILVGMAAAGGYLVWSLTNQPPLTQPASSPPSLTK
jgi:hemoglobin-like flavoprotein